MIKKLIYCTLLFLSYSLAQAMFTRGFSRLRQPAQAFSRYYQQSGPSLSRNLGTFTGALRPGVRPQIKPQFSRLYTTQPWTSRNMSTLLSRSRLSAVPQSSSYYGQLQPSPMARSLFSKVSTLLSRSRLSAVPQSGSYYGQLQSSPMARSLLSKVIRYFTPQQKPTKDATQEFSARDSYENIIAQYGKEGVVKRRELILKALFDVFKEKQDVFPTGFMQYLDEAIGKRLTFLGKMFGESYETQAKEEDVLRLKKFMSEWEKKLVELSRHDEQPLYVDEQPSHLVSGWYNNAVMEYGLPLNDWREEINFIPELLKKYKNSYHGSSDWSKDTLITYLGDAEELGRPLKSLSAEELIKRFEAIDIDPDIGFEVLEKNPIDAITTLYGYVEKIPSRDRYGNFQPLVKHVVSKSRNTISQDQLKKYLKIYELRKNLSPKLEEGRF